MSPKAPPPRATLPDPDGGEPADVGMAEMAEDGTLRLHLRTTAEDGTVGEMMMVIAPKDPRHPGMVKHLGGIVAGQARPIPPFPEPELDPDSI